MEAIRYQPRYTFDDYRQWEGDWELWDGIAVAMSPSPIYRHQRLMLALIKLIDQQLESNDGCDCELVFEHDWHISRTTVVRPDIMVVCEPFEGDYVNVPPALIVEVLSSATEEKDRTAKRSLYAAMGVGHYLMGVPEDGSVEILTLVDGEYTQATTIADDAAELQLQDGCQITVPTKVDRG